MPTVPKKWTFTLADIAKATGLNFRTLESWRQLGMPSCFERNKYDLRKTLPWIVEHVQKRTKTGKVAPASEDATKAALERRKLLADAVAKELRVRKTIGELVDRNVAKATFESMCHRIRSRLEAVPEELASSLPANLRGDYLVDADHKIRLVCREIEAWSMEANHEPGE